MVSLVRDEGHEYDKVKVERPGREYCADEVLVSIERELVTTSASDIEFVIDHSSDARAVHEGIYTTKKHGQDVLLNNPISHFAHSLNSPKTTTPHQNAIRHALRSRRRSRFASLLCSHRCSGVSRPLLIDLSLV